MAEKRPLYTNESIVTRKGLQKADLSKPITVYTDNAGNHAVADGNHRAYLSERTGKNVKRTVIGTLKEDVSRDPYMRPVKDLKVID